MRVNFYLSRIVEKLFIMSKKNFGSDEVKIKSKILAFLLSFGISATVSANPFADAPEWTFEPVAQLIDEGIIDGYDARQFSKDEVMTRYEMARLVGRAVYKIEKANSSQKILIEKLAGEFESELELFSTKTSESGNQITELKDPEIPKQKPDLNTSEQNSDSKVSEQIPEQSYNKTSDPPAEGTLPKEPSDISDLPFDTKSTKQNLERSGGKIPPFEMAAYVRQRVEFADQTSNNSSKVDLDSTYKLYLLTHLKNDWRFATRFGIDDVASDDHTGFANPQLHWMALVGPVGHETRMRLGRQNLALGYGLLVNAGKGWDGVSFDVKHGVSDYRFGYFYRSDWRHRRYFFADYSTKIDKNLDLTATYFKDTRSKLNDALLGNRESLYNAATIGAQYKFQPFTFTVEYGRNFSDKVYPKSDGYYMQLNYNNISLKKPHSWTTWLQYRNADFGFNPMGFTILDEPVKISGYQAINMSANGVHGFEFGFSYIPMTDLMATMKLWDLHREGISKFGAVAQLEYLWR